MAHIVLVACVKRKRTCRSQARDLYISDLFRKCMAYAKTLSPDAIYILSAKYGLLSLDEEIEPYEKTLNRMPITERRAWNEHVLERLRGVSDLTKDQFTFLASVRYREGLMPHMSHCEVPMKGLDFGGQLRFLKERTA